MGEFVLELWAFMRERKKFWLLPIVLILVLFGGLIVLTQGSASRRSSTRCFERRQRIAGARAAPTRPEDGSGSRDPDR